MARQRSLNCEVNNLLLYFKFYEKQPFSSDFKKVLQKNT